MKQIYILGCYNYIDLELICASTDLKLIYEHCKDLHIQNLLSFEKIEEELKNKKSCAVSKVHYQFQIDIIDLLESNNENL